MKEYEPCCGDSIEHACAALVAMAPAFMLFNDTRVEAQPGDTAGDVHARWDAGMAAAQTVRDAKQRAFDATPEGRATIAAAERRQAARLAAQPASLEGIERARVRVQFPWGTMGELSGFGGGYEAACQTMVYAGFVYLLSQGADAKTLKLEPVNRDGLDGAILEVEPCCSGAMHGMAMNVCLYVAHYGWDRWREDRRAIR